jgi:hypothetical protein
MVLSVPNWFSGKKPDSTFHSKIECEPPAGFTIIDDHDDDCEDRADFSVAANR